MPDTDTQSLDARVAEKVMGWQWCSEATERPGDIWLPHFTGDPTADYSVLVHVRETWIFSKRRAFARDLVKLWQTRVPLPNGEAEAMPGAAMRYLPGDYSRAALAVVEAVEK